MPLGCRPWGRVAPILDWVRRWSKEDNDGSATAMCSANIDKEQKVKDKGSLDIFPIFSLLRSENKLNNRCGLLRQVDIVYFL